MQRDQSEMKTIITKTKTVLDEAEGHISNLEDEAAESTQSEQQEENNPMPLGQQAGHQHSHHEGTGRRGEGKGSRT